MQCWKVAPRRRTEQRRGIDRSCSEPCAELTGTGHSSTPGRRRAETTAIFMQPWGHQRVRRKQTQTHDRNPLSHLELQTLPGSMSKPPVSCPASCPALTVSMSPMLTTNAPGIGGASTQTPSRRCTCSAVMPGSWFTNVRRPVHAWYTRRKSTPLMPGAMQPKSRDSKFQEQGQSPPVCRIVLVLNSVCVLQAPRTTFPHWGVAHLRYGRATPSNQVLYAQKRDEGGKNLHLP